MMLITSDLSVSASCCCDFSTVSSGAAAYCAQELRSNDNSQDGVSDYVTLHLHVGLIRTYNPSMRLMRDERGDYDML
jgi:hypothetical protein